MISDPAGKQALPASSSLMEKRYYFDFLHIGLIKQGKDHYWLYGLSFRVFAHDSILNLLAIMASGAKIYVLQDDSNVFATVDANQRCSAGSHVCDLESASVKVQPS